MNSPEDQQSGPPKLSNKARRKLRRQASATQSSQEQRAEQINRRKLLILLGAGTAAVVTVPIYLAARNLLGGITPEEKQNQSFKEQVLDFSWTDAENSDKAVAFIDTVIEQYIILSGSPRLSIRSMEAPGKINYYKTTDQFTNAVKNVAPSRNANDIWGYTDYNTEKVFLDFAKLKQQTLEKKPNSEAGRPILEALFHEFTHLDVTEKTQGLTINNPQAQFHSPVSGKDEMIKSFRGGVGYTDTYYGYVGFDEVWTDTISVRRMIDQVGLEEIVAVGNYYQNGTDVFIPFTYAANIPLPAMYQMHATSDFEGFATLVGEKLPGTNPSLEKGISLFTGIHQRNLEMINRTGIRDVISKTKSQKNILTLLPK